MKGELGQFRRCLLTRYAINFNRHHQRGGNLFQNRYKSMVCEKETFWNWCATFI